MSSFEDFDFESMISENVLSTPFTNYIDEMAERDGLNSRDFRRKATAIGGSYLMGSFGAIIGGPLGLIMGLMGYAAGMAVRFDDEDKEDKLIEAGMIAIKRLRRVAPEEIIDEAYDDLMHHIKYYNTHSYSNKKTLKIFYQILANVEPRAANLWLVYLKEEL